MVQEVFCDSRGVNPSVIIAQAILESGYGTSKLSKYNNIFGLNNYNDGYLVNAGYVLIEVPQEKMENSITIMRKWQHLII